MTRRRLVETSALTVTRGPRRFQVRVFRWRARIETGALWSRAERAAIKREMQT